MGEIGHQLVFALLSRTGGQLVRLVFTGDGLQGARSGLQLTRKVGPRIALEQHALHGPEQRVERIQGASQKRPHDYHHAHKEHPYGKGNLERFHQVVHAHIAILVVSVKIIGVIVSAEAVDGGCRLRHAVVGQSLIAKTVE